MKKEIIELKKKLATQQTWQEKFWKDFQISKFSNIELSKFEDWIDQNKELISQEEKEVNADDIVFPIESYAKKPLPEVVKKEAQKIYDEMNESGDLEAKRQAATAQLMFLSGASFVLNSQSLISQGNTEQPDKSEVDKDSFLKYLNDSIAGFVEAKKQHGDLIQITSRLSQVEYIREKYIEQLQSQSEEQIDNWNEVGRIFYNAVSFIIYEKTLKELESKFTITRNSKTWQH